MNNEEEINQVSDELLNLEDIQSEVGNLLVQDQVEPNLQHSEVFDEIIENLPPTDFHNEAGISYEKPISDKIYSVITNLKVLETTQSLGVGLCINNQIPYAFNGQYWRKKDQEELQNFLGRAAAKLGVDAITSKYHVFLGNLVKQFLTTAYLPTPENSSGNVRISLQNGVYEINGFNRTLRPFRREDFLTYQLPFSFDPNAVCPKWNLHLNRVLPDEASQCVLAEFIAYIFTILKLEKALLLYGDGANGKSVVFDVIIALLGSENCSNISPGSLKHEYHRAGLANKLLNYDSDISRNIDSDLFKKLVSGEPVEARLPYGQPHLIRRYAKLAFNCNELPRDVEYNKAYFRRFLILPFEVSIPEEDQNPNLASEIIESELSGIFNWVMQGLERLLAQGKFSPCDAAKNALKKYRTESDSVALFIEEAKYHKVTDKDQATLLHKIYGEYKLFCQESGLYSVSIVNLRKRLEALGFVAERINRGQLIYASANAENTLF